MLFFFLQFNKLLSRLKDLLPDIENFLFDITSFWIFLQEPKQVTDSKKPVTTLVQNSKSKKVNDVEWRIECLHNASLVLSEVN
jgi:hypothetical protein